MNLERVLLITFFGNYLTNNVIIAAVAFIPVDPTATGLLTAQYIGYAVLAALLVALLAWWYLSSQTGANLKAGATFGIIGFLVSIVTAFVTGIAGVLAQTASFSQAMGVIPDFGSFLASVSTLVLLGFWVIPSAAVGYFLQRKSSAPAI